MNAGQLRQRITIQQQTTVKDSLGQRLQSWTDFLTCYAALTAATGKQVFAASGFTSEVSHVAKMRYVRDSGIVNGMRVRYDGQVFDVTSVADLEGLRETLTLTLLQRDAGTG